MNINHKNIIAVFFFLLLIFVLAQMYFIFRPFFEAFFWAGILAFAFFPIHKAMLRILKRPTLTAIVSTLLIVIIVILPSTIILKRLASQAIELYSFLLRGGWDRVVEALRDSPTVQKYYTLAAEFITTYLGDAPSRIGPALAKFTTAQIAATTKNIFLIFLNFILTIFLLFFLLRDGTRVRNFVYRIVPLEESDKAEIFLKINETFESVIRGQLLTSLVQGFLCGITFLLLGLPAPYFFGFLTFIGTMIPVLGATSVWAPFCIYLFAVQETKQAVILLVVGTFVISGIDNVLKPILIGERIKIPIFLLLFGVLGGMQAYGFTGIFLGPLFITVFFALVRIYQSRYTNATRPQD